MSTEGLKDDDGKLRYDLIPWEILHVLAWIFTVGAAKFDGGEVIANAETNRLQIFFGDKPGEALRCELKRNGFRWAPSAGAWQRQLTGNAISAAKSILPNKQ